MRFYEINDLARRLDVPLNDQEFAHEGDWCTDAGGTGLPGGKGNPRWLITYIHPNPFLASSPFLVHDHDETAYKDPHGWLVGIEISGAHTRTGRCVLLAGPWSPAEDADQFARAAQQPWFSQGLDLNQLRHWLVTTTKAPTRT